MGIGGVTPRFGFSRHAWELETTLVELLSLKEEFLIVRLWVSMMSL